MSGQEMDVDGAPDGSVQDRAIVRTFVAGAGLQLAIAASTLVALPFVTRDLSAAEFGVFATLTGFSVLLSFADLGIGGAVTTDLGRAIGRGALSQGQRSVSTAVVASGFVGGALAAVLGLSVTFFPWRQLLGAEHVTGAATREAVLVVALVTGLSVPASLGQRLMYGVRRGPTANYVLVGGAVVGAGLLILAAELHWPLAAFVGVSLGSPVAAGLVCGLLALRGWPSLRPRARLASMVEWKRMRASSGWHFLIGLAGAVSFQTDALVVSSILGAAAAGIFAVATRLFGLVVQALYPAMLQLWPAVSEAYERRDHAWIRSRVLRVTLAAGAVSAVAGIVLVWLAPSLVGLALTDATVPPRPLLVALACWTTYSLISAPSFLLLNATGRVHVHALTATAVAIVNLPLTIVLTHEVGISGPIWASLAAGAVVSAVPWAIAVRRVLYEDGQSSGATRSPR